jgi:hypothetical protein
VPAAQECAGAPRDLGRDQGAAARALVRARVGGRGWRRALDRAGVCGRPLSRWRRDLRRHFPHQHEWLEGVARAAGVPDLALLRAATLELARERDALLVGVEAGSDARVWRSGAPDTVLRRVRPEGRLVSLELASPVLACPWIGVNEAGLAVATTGGDVADGGVQPALLARDCLERFERVESALDWCLLRPVAADTAILLADAHGELAGIDFGMTARSVRRPAAGAIVLGGSRAAAVAKAVSGAGGSPPAVEAALRRALGDAAAAAAAHAAPATRSLRPASGDAALRVESESSG